MHVVKIVRERTPYISLCTENIKRFRIETRTTRVVVEGENVYTDKCTVKTF